MLSTLTCFIAYQTRCEGKQTNVCVQRMGSQSHLRKEAQNTTKFLGSISCAMPRTRSLIASKFSGVVVLFISSVQGIVNAVNDPCSHIFIADIEQIEIVPICDYLRMASAIRNNKCLISS